MESRVTVPWKSITLAKKCCFFSSLPRPWKAPWDFHWFGLKMLWLTWIHSLGSIPTRQRSSSSMMFSNTFRRWASEKCSGADAEQNDGFSCWGMLIVKTWPFRAPLSILVLLSEVSDLPRKPVPTVKTLGECTWLKLLVMFLRAVLRVFCQVGHSSLITTQNIVNHSLAEPAFNIYSSILRSREILLLNWTWIFAIRLDIFHLAFVIQIVKTKYALQHILLIARWCHSKYILAFRIKMCSILISSSFLLIFILFVSAADVSFELPMERCPGWLESSCWAAGKVTGGLTGPLRGAVNLPLSLVSLPPFLFKTFPAPD